MEELNIENKEVLNSINTVLKLEKEEIIDSLIIIIKQNIQTFKELFKEEENIEFRFNDIRILNDYIEELESFNYKEEDMLMLERIRLIQKNVKLFSCKIGKYDILNES